MGDTENNERYFLLSGGHQETRSKGAKSIFNKHKSEMTNILFYLRKYWLLELTILTLILICGCGHLEVADHCCGPKMVLKERDFDFGEVKQGEVITHTFEVLNQGDEMLKIKKVSPS